VKRPKSRAISAKEVKRILDATPLSVDHPISRIAMCEAFDVADGGVLLRFENGKGRLYKSKEELQAMLDELEKKAREGPESPCRDFPQGQAFAEQIPRLVGLLPALLNINAAQLDGTEASLDTVDKALRRMRPDRMLEAEVFAALTAYVGEVIRNATQGRWEMRRGSDSKGTWEPWIIDPSGHTYPPFAIYKELFEYGRSASLRAFVAGTLGARLLGRPHTVQVTIKG
jgi:hypothetical protein